MEEETEKNIFQDVAMCGLSASKYVLCKRISWWRGSVVERRSLAGELSLSCARPAADG